MTSSSLEQGLDKLLEKVGQLVSKSHWFEVTQVLINQYADVSRDHQWIHVDAERAEKGKSLWGRDCAREFDACINRPSA